MKGDARRKDPLPIEDLLWSESLDMGDVEELTRYPPTLDTPFSTTVSGTDDNRYRANLSQVYQTYVVANKTGRAIGPRMPDSASSRSSSSTCVQPSLRSRVSEERSFPARAHFGIVLALAGQRGAQDREVLRSVRYMQQVSRSPCHITMRKCKKSNGNSALFVLYESMLRDPV